MAWLAQAPAGALVVGVREVGEHHLLLERLVPTTPTRDAAQQFGRGLALTHAPVEAYGAPPARWQGDGFFGPLSDPLPLPLRPAPAWAEHLQANLLHPLLQRCRDAHALSEYQTATIERAARRSEHLDPGEPPARIHGDLWSGNVMWTEQGATLIDPAAHSGHREADLAMLALFGAPYLDETVASYDETRALSEGWRERVGLHQLFPLAVHALLFGGGYAERTRAVAARYL